MTIAPPAPTASEDQSPWTAAELATARSQLKREIARLRIELASAENEFGKNVRDVIEDAGGEVADVGSLACDLMSGTSMANNVRDILDQCEQALERIKEHRYGACDSCERPIGKARLEALPRATFCVNCQQAARSFA